MKVENGCEVTMDYELRVDGEGDSIIDKSEPGTPLKYLQGTGQIIIGLEKHIEGMVAGDTKDVEVKPDEAYGHADASNVINVPLSELPPDLPKHVGANLQYSAEDGKIFYGIVKEANENALTVDFNHPLADKTLNFKIKIIEVKKL